MKPTLLATTLLFVTTSGAAFADRRGDFTFNDFDTNADGVITVADMETYQAARFAGLDTDSDGALTEAELKAGADGRMARRSARMIKRVDANDNGQIEQAEFMSASFATRMFDRLDADDNGEISSAEFEKLRHGRGGKRDRKSDKDRGTGGSNI